MVGEIFPNLAAERLKLLLLELGGKLSAIILEDAESNFDNRLHWPFTALCFSPDHSENLI
jgi:acyl-CoA reductase-like NAD-dependent aldehyde dehydrogenase